MNLFSNVYRKTNSNNIFIEKIVILNLHDILLQKKI